MVKRFRLPSANVLKNSLGHLVDEGQVRFFTEYGEGEYSEEVLRTMLQGTFGQDKGGDLLPQILELSQQVSP
jgi:hypothetical protein